MAPAKRRRRRAGDDVRAARASFVIIAGEPNPSPPLQHVEEQLFFVRGGFFTCAASRSEFSNVVPRRRRDGCGLGRFARLDVRRGLRRTRAGARVGNAPVASAGLPRTVLRGAASSALRARARFCCILAAMRFLLFALREGARFAGGLVRCGCGLPSLFFLKFRVRRLSFDVGCTGQIGKLAGQIRNHGFFLLRIQMTLIFSKHLSQRS